MIIIIDTNILISALIKDSTVRRILINSGLRFYYPEASFHEVRKYKSMILEKSGLGDAEFERVLGKILEYVALVPTETINGHLNDSGLKARTSKPGAQSALIRSRIRPTLLRLESQSFFANSLKEARNVMEHIDPKDVAFLAAALSYEPSVIWSDDRDFERQDRIKVVKTAQFVKLLSRMYGRNS